MNKFTLIFMSFFVAAPILVNAQSTFQGDSPPISLAIMGKNVPLSKTPPAVYIKKYVENIIVEWQKKGEFEKTSDYQVRVNEQNRMAKVQELTNQAVDALKRDYSASINWRELQLSQYDADNETYLIKSTQLGDFALPVAIADAQYFKQNWGSMSIQNTDFYIKGNKLILAKLSFSNPNDGKNYVYDSQQSTTYSANNITYNFAPIEIDVPRDNRQTSNTKIENKSIVLGQSDVDINIPKTGTTKPNTYALIIGNEDYKSFQTDLSSEVNVEFAKNDAQVFADYCKSTLGIPDKQVKVLTNATGSIMKQGLAWIKNLAGLKKGDAELIFYYSGHGLPDEVTKEPYLIPVDVSGTQIQYAIKLDDVYAALTENPTKQVTVFLDACFSGGARNESLIAMKGVKVKPKTSVALNNMVIFASSSGDESSAVFREKQHGFFTYFLLKKLQDTKGDVTFGQLSSYLTENVTIETGLISKKQTPQVMVDPGLQYKFANMKLK